MHYTKKLALGGALLMSQVSFAHGPLPGSLIDYPVPPVPGLVDGADPIVTDENMAIALGKALFWDTAVGSDGMACASCHFNAGADSRIKNQLNPGDKGSKATSTTFETMASGATGGPNYTLTQSDFPFFQFSDPFSQFSTILFESDDVAASSGTFSGDFQDTPRFEGDDDDCVRSADFTFHVNNDGTRRVEPRNAPTVINAFLNHRNFWDGRANNVFNGSSNWGDRDPNAGVWVKVGRRSVQKQRLNLINSSLASLAVAPPQSDTEMACRNRSLADLGRKMLLRQPLQNQKVHDADSVFGPMNLTLSSPGDLQPGLNTTYKQMVRLAFDKKYWSYSRRVFGAPAVGTPYTQMEANFSMFFGLALQMYQATLFSNQAPIDLTPRNTDPNDSANYYIPTFEGMGYTEAEKTSLISGFRQFEASHCNLCHAGPATTSAAIAANTLVVTPTPGAFYGPAHSRIAFGPDAMGYDNAAANSNITQYGSLIDRRQTNGGIMLMDVGFLNTAVARLDEDPGIDATDDFGNPLSFVEQYIQYLIGNPAGISDTSAGINQVRSCDFFLALAENANFSSNFIFTALNNIIVDGTHEGTPRTANCKDPNKAYIPSIAEANAHLGTGKMAVITTAAFKVPSLRNIALTGPYMHNGSILTLSQVIEFYARAGNFFNLSTEASLFNVGMNMPGDAQQRADLEFFLREALTDPRVTRQQAPFDHPEIKIPHGHIGDHNAVTAGHPLEASLAEDEFLIIPAVGAGGMATPIPEFSTLLAP